LEEQLINTINLLGIRIDEPIVTVTDLLVSVLCFIFFRKLYRSGAKERLSQYFTTYFLFMGVATAMGGLIGHAFLYTIDSSWILPGWICSIISIMLMERAAIEQSRTLLATNLIKVLFITNIVEFLLFLTLTVATANFSFVTVYSIYGLLGVVLSLQMYLFLKTRNLGSLQIMFGIFFGVCAAIFFVSKISIHQWFNFKAISHIFIAVAVFCFYRGAILIQTSETERKNLVLIESI
jgi:MFS family permease